MSGLTPSPPCLACPTCNQHKANRINGLTDEGAEARLFHPQFDSWLDHFDWSVNSTVNALRMNRPQLVEVRSLWIIVGKHPPS